MLINGTTLTEIKCSEWKTTLTNRCKEENTETKVDNGVHPLHWATYPGPSPMGTDPINLFKMVQNGYGINFNNCKQNVVQSL